VKDINLFQENVQDNLGGWQVILARKSKIRIAFSQFCSEALWKTQLYIQPRGDVGCGAGIRAGALARIGADVTAVDACPTNIEAVKVPSLVNNLEYNCTTVEEHVDVFGDEYDAIVASEVIEHVDNPEIFLRKCYQVETVGWIIFLDNHQQIY